MNKKSIVVKEVTTEELIVEIKKRCNRLDIVVHEELLRLLRGDDIHGMLKYASDVKTYEETEKAALLDIVVLLNQIISQTNK